MMDNLQFDLQISRFLKPPLYLLKGALVVVNRYKHHQILTWCKSLFLEFPRVFCINWKKYNFLTDWNVLLWWYSQTDNIAVIAFKVSFFNCSFLFNTFPIYNLMMVKVYLYQFSHNLFLDLLMFTLRSYFECQSSDNVRAISSKWHYYILY